MSTLGSIISVVAPEILEIADSLKQSKKSNSKKVQNSNNDDISNENEPKLEKDICEKDCICEDIKINNSTNNKIKTSTLNKNEIRKYIVYSDILGVPACKRNRKY